MGWTTRTPFGRKLEQGANRPADWLGTVSVLAEATPGNLKAARRFLQQGNEDDFQREGRTWTDRATGQTYRLVHGQPLATPRPDGTSDLFLVVDGNLIFCSVRGPISRGRSNWAVSAAGRLRPTTPSPVTSRWSTDGSRQAGHPLCGQ
jgi:hypothetical protein